MTSYVMQLTHDLLNYATNMTCKDMNLNPTCYPRLQTQPSFPGLLQYLSARHSLPRDWSLNFASHTVAVLQSQLFVPLLLASLLWVLIDKNLWPVLPWMYEKLPHFYSRTRKTPLPRSESAEKSSQDGGASIDHEVLDQFESPEPINQCLSAIAETYVAKKGYNTSNIRNRSWRNSSSCEHKDVASNSIKY